MARRKTHRSSGNERSGGDYQRMVRHLIETADRVIKDADTRHRQISKGQLVFGDCYAVHHECVYDLENAVRKIKAEMPNYPSSPTAADGSGGSERKRE